VRLTAKGRYYLTLEGLYLPGNEDTLPEHDDREPTMLEFEPPRAGVPIDIAIYLASRDQEADAGHDVTVDATISIEPEWYEGIGTLVVDAHDTVSFGEPFIDYLGTSSNLHRIEVVSRTSETLDQAGGNPYDPSDDKLPYADSPSSIFGDWTQPPPEGTTGSNKAYLLRGPYTLALAEELARAENPPLPAVSPPPMGEEEEVSVEERKDSVAEIEAKYPGLLRLPFPDDPALASDVELRKIAEHFQRVEKVLREHQDRAMAALNERAAEWRNLTWDAESIAAFEQQLATDPALAAWMSNAFDFVWTAKARCGHSEDDAIGFFSQHLALANDDAYDVVDAYLRAKLESMHKI